VECDDYDGSTSRAVFNHGKRGAQAENNLGCLE
jgi:hypothetical protein